MVESEEKLKSLLMKVKEESDKADLKLNIKKIRSWHRIPSWQIDGETMETERLFSWTPNSLQIVTVTKILKDPFSLEEKL